MSASGYLHFDVDLIARETDLAFLLQIDGLDEAVWVPKKVIAHYKDYAEGDEDCVVSIQDWFCAKNRLV